MNPKIIAEQIFRAGIARVQPDKMIRSQVHIQDSVLSISSVQFPLEALNRIFVIGAGKASALMARELEKILGDRIAEGHVVVKYGHACALKYIHVYEAGHPIPDNNGSLATQKIVALAERAGENDLIICLLSGGGSALLADFPEGSSLHDLVLINDLLLRSGADIKEINAVRKHLSGVKGGQLAKIAQPAFLVSFILSDVIGDPLDAIASGPTVADTSTFDSALHVLKKYDLLSKIPLPLANHLRKGKEGIHPETPKPGDPIFNNTTTILIGSNKIALEAAQEKAQALALEAILITATLEGDTFKVAQQMVDTALQVQKDSLIKKPCCLLFGGETTLRVKGNGTGGRNQHLALCGALLLKDHPGITLLAGGTDGNDGPTNAAGAVVDSKTAEHALTSGADPEKYLVNFDSFHFFQKAGGHIITGPTMTNVMDLMVLIIE